MLSQWQLYVLILPAIAYLILFNYIPMYGVQIAFKDFRPSLGIIGSKWAGLKYFSRFINHPNFGQIIGNTVRISAYMLALFPLALLLALLLNELNSQKFKKTAQMITYAPHFISTVVICAMLTLFMGKNGVFNTLLSLLGVPRQDYLTYPEYFAGIYVWSGVWQGVGFGTVIYMSALSGVSQELVEAARIDGATRMKIIWHVNVPAILPTIVTMLILRCGNILSVGFEKVYLLQNSLNLEASQVISTYVYDIGLQKAQYSYSSAIGLMNTVVNVVLLLIVNHVSKKVTEIGMW